MTTAIKPLTSWTYRTVANRETAALESPDPVALSVDWSYQVYGQVVYFYDHHVGPATSFLWDFGQLGATSTKQNPVHAYTVPAGTTITVTVRLTINGTDFLEFDIDVSAPHAGPGGGLAAITLTIDEAVNMTAQEAIEMTII